MGPSTSSSLFPLHSHSWLSSSSGTLLSSPSIDTRSPGGDDLSSLSSLHATGFPDFSSSRSSSSYSGHPGSVSGSYGGDSSSVEVLSRKVETLSEQVHCMKEDIQKLLPKLDLLVGVTQTSAHSTREAVWMRDGYAAYNQKPRIAPKSRELNQLKAMYPAVKIWVPQNFKPNNDVASRGKSLRPAGGMDRKNDVNNDGKYIEFSNGEVIGGQEFGQIREELNALLMDVLAAGKAMSRLALLGHQVRGALVYMLEHRFPYLSLCTDNWKAHRVIARRYRFWVKPLISKGLIQNDGGSNSGGDNNNNNAVTGSKRKGSVRSKAPKRQRVLPNPATNPSLLRLSTTHDDPPADPPQEPLPPEQPETTQLHDTPPSGLDSGPPGSPARTPPTVDEPEDDLFTSVLVPPPLPPPSPPPSSTPAAATTTAPPVAEPTVSVASKKACKPNPIHFTPRNLYMAVYADDVGGSSNEFTQHWPSLATENPGLLQAYKTYSKELKLQKLPHIPVVQDIRQRIQALLQSPTP